MRPFNWIKTRASKVTEPDLVETPEYTGPDRRQKPVTRAFVLSLFVVTILYVTFVFAAVQINGHNDKVRVDNQAKEDKKDSQDRAQTQYENDLKSCDRGDDIRRAINSVVENNLRLGECRANVVKPKGVTTPEELRVPKVTSPTKDMP